MTARRLLAAIGVVAALGAGIAGAPAAPAAAVTAGDAAAQLVVAPRGGGVVAPGDPLLVDVEVRNTGTTALAAGDLTFSMDRAPQASSRALLEAIANPPDVLLGQLTEAVARTPALEPGETARVRARIDGDDVDSILAADAADGARLLYVRLRAGAVKTVAESAVVRMGADAPDVGFGTVIPLTAPVSTTGVVDTAQQAQLTGPDGAWTAALAAARATPTAVVALDPAVIASVRLAGDAAPESARRFLADLDGLPNAVAQLPYADGDTALQRAAGAAAPLGPTSFTGASTAPAPTAAPAAAASATPAAGGPAAADPPTEWDWTGGALTWPVPGTASAEDLAAAAEQQGVVLLGAADVRDGAARSAAGPMAVIGGARVLVAERATSRLLATAATDGFDGAAAVAPLIGALATDAVTRATPAVLAVAGRNASAAGLARVLAVVDGQRWIRGETLEKMTSRAPTGLELRADPSLPATRVATARGLLEAEEVVQRLAAAVPDPDALTGPSRLRLLALLSTRWRGDDAGWSAAADEAADGFRAFGKQVSVVDSGATTLSGVDGTLRVSVQNDLPQPVTVDVNAAVNNGRLQFTGAPSTRIVVPADTRAPALLAFRTIANGPAVVTLRLTTQDGAPLGGPVDRRVSVSAGFDTIVAVVLLTLLGLLLALGVYRNIARRRRPRAER